ncbi:MAG TPA: ATPase, partial [Paenibacillus sp.]|nr:ATPase [Paenibacillus sp.]
MSQERLQDIMRLPAERLYEHELEALRKADTGKIPAGWQMSPQSVLKFIVGG